MTEIRPCPFCGSATDLRIVTRQDYGAYHKTGIECRRCMFTILYCSDTDDEAEKRRQAIGKWNRRAPA